jgi:uncharacterized protein YjbI with pentapeptide repeats
MPVRVQVVECGPKLVAHTEHLALLQQGVDVWNAWRAEKPSVHTDLTEANLRRADLRRADLHRADFGRADLGGADLIGANLSRANLSRANLGRADFSGADLGGADLREASLRGASLSRADLVGANLGGADLIEANLMGANLSGANLGGADLGGADLRGASLRGADLSKANLGGANLGEATLVQTNLADADLSGCNIYGISAWNVGLSKGTKQDNLTITAPGEPAVTVDNIEVAQFVYLLLHNEKIRDVIDTVTSKVVLILGRFTPERKAVLDAIRKELRLRHYVPILFDFEPSARRDITETVTLLARMALFIIADLTEPSSIPKELEAIVPHLAVPVQPLLEGERPYAMFTDYWKYDWVLPVHRYDGLDALLGTLADKVIVPAETMTNALAEKRRRFEAELIQPR